MTTTWKGLPGLLRKWRSVDPGVISMGAFALVRGRVFDAFKALFEGSDTVHYRVESRDGKGCTWYPTIEDAASACVENGWILHSICVFRKSGQYRYNLYLHFDQEQNMSGVELDATNKYTTTNWESASMTALASMFI